jgi:hypothetical protein
MKMAGYTGSELAFFCHPEGICSREKSSKNSPHDVDGCLRHDNRVKMKMFLFTFLFAFFSFSLLSQTKSTNAYTLLFEIKTDAKDFTTDKLQNIYLLDAKNEIVKLTPEGKEQFRYPNTTLGEPSYLDATNPFNLLLYFSDFQNVVTLDRTLNLAGEINLQELGFFRVNALGMAGDGNLWIYDEVDFRLKKIGRDGRIILQSADLSLELRQGLRPNFLIERDQQVFLNDSEIGVLVFDVFGRYLKTIPIKGLEDFQVVGRELVFLENHQLQSFHLDAYLQSPLRLPAPLANSSKDISEEKKVRLEKDRLYILEKGKLQVYQF